MSGHRLTVGESAMVTINQDNARIQNQFVADLLELNGMSFSGSADGEGASVLEQLRKTESSVGAAVKLGHLSTEDGATLTKALRGAIDSMQAGDVRSASEKVEQASRVLQVAAPLAAIGAALVSVWRGLSGGA
jgi:hypothetical protein